MIRPRNPGYSINSAPSGTGNRTRCGKLALNSRLSTAGSYLGMITPKNLPNSCCPRWVWRSCMCRTDCGCCHEAHCPSEQKLVVSKFRWQKISPHAPSNRSSQELIYSILMGGFRESKLSESFLPVINHRKRWPIHLHLRMILKKRSQSWSGLRSPPPSPLQCNIRGRSCMGNRLPKVPPMKKPIVPTCEGDQASLAIHWMPCLYTSVGHSGQHQRCGP